jgi:hypothetical protein
MTRRKLLLIHALIWLEGWVYGILEIVRAIRMRVVHGVRRDMDAQSGTMDAEPKSPTNS